MMEMHIAINEGGYLSDSGGDSGREVELGTPMAGFGYIEASHGRAHHVQLVSLIGANLPYGSKGSCFSCFAARAFSPGW